jgi:hypothetical protein
MQDRISRYGLVAVALVASMLGGTVGAYVSTRMVQPSPVAAAPADATPAPVAQVPTPAPMMQQPTLDPATLPADATEQVAPEPTRVAYAPAPSRGKSRVASKSSTRRVYYSSDAQRAAPSRSYYEYKKPSFWSRHRDLMTIAVGTGVGTAVGAIAGGGKGAAIGALAGGGGTGVYTLVRKRQQN